MYRYVIVTPGGYVKPVGKAKDEADAVRLFLLTYHESMRKTWDEMKKLGWTVEHA